MIVESDTIASERTMSHDPQKQIESNKLGYMGRPGTGRERERLGDTGGLGGRVARGTGDERHVGVGGWDGIGQRLFSSEGSRGYLRCEDAVGMAVERRENKSALY